MCIACRCQTKAGSPSHSFLIRVVLNSQAGHIKVDASISSMGVEQIMSCVKATRIMDQKPAERFSSQRAAPAVLVFQSWADGHLL